MIVAAAERGGCGRIWSEDLSAGQKYFGIAVENPAFDVTPHRYVAAIITERGVARAPFSESLASLAAEPEPVSLN